MLPHAANSDLRVGEAGCWVSLDSVLLVVVSVDAVGRDGGWVEVGEEGERASS